MKKMFQQISQKSQESTCAGVSSLSCRLETGTKIQKEYGTGALQEILQNFSECQFSECFQETFKFFQDIYMYMYISVLKISNKFTGEQPCRSLILINLGVLL